MPTSSCAARRAARASSRVQIAAVAHTPCRSRSRQPHRRCQTTSERPPARRSPLGRSSCPASHRRRWWAQRRSRREFRAVWHNALIQQPRSVGDTAADVLLDLALLVLVDERPDVGSRIIGSPTTSRLVASTNCAANSSYSGECTTSRETSRCTLRPGCRTCLRPLSGPPLERLRRRARARVLRRAQAW